MVRFHRRFDPQALDLVVFDLDGTLIDSRLDLIHSVNAMLRHLGRAELDGDVVASHVGDGAPTLIRRVLGEGEGEKLFQDALEYFLAYYKEHKLDHTTVYAGIPEALRQIQGNGAGRQMAVLSTRAIVEALGLSPFFTAVYGGNSFETKKPDPLGALTILQETGVSADRALIVGDSSVDVLTGRNAGLATCGVTYGFAPHTLEEVQPDMVIDSPLELKELFR